MPTATVTAAAQLGELLLEALSAVDGDGPAFRVGGQLFGFLGHLDHQLARGSENDRLWAALAVLNAPAIEEGQQEGGGLAGPGLGLTENVTTGKGFRDEGSLNRGRFTVAGAVEGGQQFGA